jgi:hypothetical protein
VKTVKKVIVAVVLASLLLTTLAIPVLAGSGDENVDVVCGDIDIDGDPVVGSTVTVSGNITITSEALAFFNNWCAGFATTSSQGYYNVTDPGGASVANGSNSEWAMGFGANPPGPWNFPAWSDSSQVFDWTTDVFLDQAGIWTVSHGGTADASWVEFFFIWMTDWGYDHDECQVNLDFHAINPYPLQSFFAMSDGGCHEFPLLDGVLVQGVTICWGSGYCLQIPAGTILTDANGAIVTRITLLDTDPVLFDPDTIHFSKQATLILPDGFVAEAGGTPSNTINFSEVVNGQVVPD